MAIGGPASFGAGFFKGFASHRRNAQSNAREQLNEALRLQKEDRESKEAIAKEGLSFEKAKSEAALAQSELALVEQRRAQIMASPGAPFKDAALEGHLEEARSRLEDAHAELQERQGKLQDLIADRDARVRGAIPPTKAGGFLGFGQSEVPPEKRTPEQREAYKAAIVKGEREQGAEFNKAANPVEREIRQAEAGESRERAKIAGGEKAIASGQSQQGAINEEKRNAQTFPLDQRASELRAKQIESQSAMAAAAQEIQARQQQQAALQATPGYSRAMQGGSATGKGGGGGGLLGAITGKGGGGGVEGASTVGGGAQAGGGPVPTLGQAIGPMIGKMAQMPLPQAAGLIKSVLGGNQGGPARGTPVATPGPGSPTGPGGAPVQQGNYQGQPYAYAAPGGPQSAAGFQGGGGGPLPPQRPGAPFPPQRPQFGPPQSFAGPRRPVQVPVPSVAMEGRGGGGTPSATQLAVREALAARGYGPNAQAAIMGNIRQESNFDPRMNTRGGDSGTAHGLFQDRGPRFTGELNYARSHGLDPSSVGAQIGFADQEIAGMPGLKQRLNQSDPASGAMLFGKQFERPKTVESSRARYAQQFAGGGPVKTGGGQSYPSAGSSPPLPPSRPASTDQGAAGGSPQKQGFKPPKASAPPVPDVYHPTPSQPIDIKPFAGQPGPQQSPQQMGMQTYGGQQGGQPQGMAPPPADIGPPMIHSPEQLKGLKPGSLFRAPDGRLKIVPMIEAGQ